jgi:chromosome segregation ATPase
MNLMTFDDKQQKENRQAFIDECRQKAWGAACHADWIGKSVDQLLADYKKLQEDDHTLEADIKDLDGRVDYHTVENRNKRKALQEKRNKIAEQLKFLGPVAQNGVKQMEQMQSSIETNLALAKHAETWEWKESQSVPE